MDGVSGSTKKQGGSHTAATADNKRHLGEDNDEDDDAAKGKCHQMGIDIMNQNLSAWQPVVLIQYLATTLVRAVGPYLQLF